MCGHSDALKCYCIVDKVEFLRVHPIEQNLRKKNGEDPSTVHLEGHGEKVVTHQIRRAFP